MILCRDCLVHLSDKHIKYTLINFKKSKSKYLLTTTFCLLSENRNIRTGDWRPINLQLPPFSFPEPIMLIDEKCPDDGGFRKSLGLWQLKDIKI
jgi:hypothetical protein